MRNKPVPEEVNRFFKNNPNEVKYSRAQSGLSHSYIRKEDGQHTRLANKEDSNQKRGAGAFGTVKSSESNRQATVMKIQTRSLEDDPDHMQNLQENLANEAEINLDFGIAVSPLVERVDRSKNRIKYYQEMIPLEATLETSLETANPKERMQKAIDFLLLVDACHCGELTQSGKGYMHGDLSTRNVMYDQQGKLRLIDFAFSKPLDKPYYIYDDYKNALSSIYHKVDTDDDSTVTMDEPRSILTEAQFNSLPMHLQKTLAWQKSLRPDVPPHQLFPFITAVLISYQENSNISEQEIEDLKTDPYQQIMIIEQYKRKIAILELPNPVADRTLNNIISKLERYKGFLDKKALLEPPRISAEKKALFAQKQEIMSQLIDSIHYLRSFNKSSQELLAMIDKTLLENEMLFSPNAGSEKGVFKFKSNIFSGKLNTEVITNKIDKKIGRSSTIYREAMREQRERSETMTSNLSSDTETSSADSSPTPSLKKRA